MRRFPTQLLFLLWLALGTENTLHAQAAVQDPSNFIPRYSVTLGYNNIRANAPPAACGCFNMSGGSASLAMPIRYWLSAAAEMTGGHASQIGPLGQNLTLTSIAAGPRITFRRNNFVPFAQLLLGAAHGSDSYFPENGTYSTSATSFALSAGGGLDYHLTHRYALHVLQLQYLHTSFPNGTTHSQQHLMLGAGLVLNFGGHYAMPRSDRNR